MGLQETTLLSFAGNQKTLDIMSQMTGNEYTSFDVVEQAFSRAEKEGQVYIYSSKVNDNTIRYFPTNLKTVLKEDIWIYSQQVSDKTGTKKWFSTFPITKSDLLLKLITFNTVCIGNLRFENVTELNNFLKHLADKALPEEWTPKLYKAGIPYPVLKNYLENTFIKLLLEYRLKNEGDSRYKDLNPIVEYNGRIYFNTGLLDKYYNQIIISAVPFTERIDMPGFDNEQYQWYINIGAYSSNEYMISKDFNEQDLPTLAQYYSNPADLIYNADLQVNLNDRHIFVDGLEKGRIEKYKAQYDLLKDNDRKRRALVDSVIKEFYTAVSHSRKLAKRNYRLVIPQYRKETDEIQFLMPIYLDGNLEEGAPPQCALALKYDCSGRVPNYRAVTVLPISIAYLNARLIARPSLTWILQ